MMKLDQGYNFIWAKHQGNHSGWRVLASLILVVLPAILIAFVGQKFVIAPFFETLGDDSDGIKSAVFALYLIILFGSAIVTLSLCVKYIHKRPILSLFTAGQAFRANDFGIGFTVYAVLMILATIAFDSHAVSEAIANKGVTVLLLTAVPFMIGFAVQGSAEEVLMRGYLPQVLTRGLSSPVLAMAITSLGFAALHIGYGLQSFLFSMLFAIFAFTVVMLKGSLAEICGAHAANNFLIAWLLSDLPEATQNTGWSFDYKELIQQLLIFTGFIAIIIYRQRQALHQSATYVEQHAQ